MILPLDDLSVFLSHDLFPCSCLWYSIPWVSGIAWSCLRPPPSSLYLLIALRLFSLRWTSFVHFFCLTISLSTDASFFSFCCIPAQVVFSRLNLNSLIPKSLYFISTTECSLCLLRCLILWFPWYTILSLSLSLFFGFIPFVWFWKSIICFPSRPSLISRIFHQKRHHKNRHLSLSKGVGGDFTVQFQLKEKF